MKRIEYLDSSTNFISKLNSSKSTKSIITSSPTSKQSKFSWFFNCSGSENSRSTSDQSIEGKLLTFSKFYKKHLCFQPGVKPVEIWTIGSIPIVNQILSNPKKSGKTLEPIVLGH